LPTKFLLLTELTDWDLLIKSELGSRKSFCAAATKISHCRDFIRFVMVPKRMDMAGIWGLELEVRAVEI